MSSYHNYDNNERLDMLLVYGECHGNGVATRRRYKELFPTRNLPVSATIQQVLCTARETGVLQSHRRMNAGAGLSSRTILKEEKVLELKEENPNLSIRQISTLLKVPRGLVIRVLRDFESSSRPSQSQKIIGLPPRFFPVRMMFCQWLLENIAKDGQFCCNILFTDEVSFTSNGVFNFNDIQELPTEDKPRFHVNVWAGFVDNNIIGPFILPDVVDGENYLRFLQNDLQPLLEEVPLNVRQNMWFMHNGEYLHFISSVREHLNNVYADEWIARGGPQIWPPESPDLNPINFFFWKYLKSLVYSYQILNVDDLRSRIIENSTYICQQVGHVNQIQNSLARRAHLCASMGGGSFQHLL